MNFAGICLNKPSNNKNGRPLANLNTGDVLYTKCSRADGSVENIFHVNLIYLLDKVFMDNCFDNLSLKQEQFFKKFIKEGEAVNEAINNNELNPRKNMTEIFKELDSFLGGYIGVNNGKYRK